MSVFKIGDKVTGEVTSIQSYGAFITLDEKTRGLVHISEITNDFVNNISEFLEVGQKVKVKILEIDEKNNKINLSIRALENQGRRNEKKIQKGSDKGFAILREKLDEWIKKADK